MSCTATIKYDKRLVRRALNRFMVKRLGMSFFVAIFAVVAVLLASYLSGYWSLILNIVSIALGAAIAFLIYVYIARLRSAEGFFDKADEPTATLTFTDDGVLTDSDLGTTNLKWQVFDEILKFPDIWLLVYAKSGYMTLPLDQLTPECCNFIEQKISANAK